MTRKESGWVSDAMRLIGAYCQECAAQPDPNARQQREALNAINSHLTSLQSAAEGLEGALPDEAQAEHWRSLGDGLMHEQRTGPMLREAAMQLHNAYLAATAMRAALAAFQAIKEKQQ